MKNDNDRQQLLNDHIDSNENKIHHVAKIRSIDDFNANLLNDIHVQNKISNSNDDIQNIKKNNPDVVNDIHAKGDTTNEHDDVKYIKKNNPDVVNDIHAKGDTTNGTI